MAGDEHVRVLLIEDSPTAAQATEFFLECSLTTPYSVDCTDRLASGLERLAGGHVDLVLLDLNLPDSQGLDTFATLHTQFPDVPIVILSADGDAAVARAAVSSGAQDYLVKSHFNDETLARSVQFALMRSDRIRMERTLREQVARQAEQLQRYAADLERMNKELGEFARVTSHDLKEPLRSILHHVTNIVRGHGETLAPEVRTRLEKVGTLCRSMDELIDSLLTYSRVGRVDFSIRETDLNQVFADVLDSLHGTLQERSVEVRVRGRLPVAPCDGVQIAQVFRNLITNAVRYNDKATKGVSP